jgi:hypothetical protein
MIERQVYLFIKSRRIKDALRALVVIVKCQGVPLAKAMARGPNRVGRNPHYDGAIIPEINQFQRFGRFHFDTI